MKNWPHVKDIFSFWAIDRKDAGDIFSTTAVTAWERTWQKIKFDNVVRVLIAVPTYVACYVLWLRDAIASILPMTYVFLGYGAVQLALTVIFNNVKKIRLPDFLFSTFDLVGMSLAVASTGGVDSPLYFLYFIPLIVHAFHRDWGIVLYYGFGGVMFYSLVIWQSVGILTPDLITAMTARLFFMLLTVSISCMALTLLRRRDQVEEDKLRRLRKLVQISGTLNHLLSLDEIPAITNDVLTHVNEALGSSVKPWSRYMMVQKEAFLLKTVALPKNDQSGMAQELQASTCPAMRARETFLSSDSVQEGECPTEKFAFGSHICLPVGGTENEAFGVLFVGSPIKNAFRQGEIQFLEFVAKSLGLAIQRLKRMEELRKSLEMNSCVMALLIASSRSLDATLEAALDGLSTILMTSYITLKFSYRGLTSQKSAAPESSATTWEERAHVFEIKNLKGEKFGEMAAATANPQKWFDAIEVETASTYAMRAALAIENAIAHEYERDQIDKLQGVMRRKAA